MLKRDEILSKKELRREKVSIPEWGGDVFVSEMSAESRDEWEQAIVTRDKNKNLQNPRAKLAVATIVDENGERIFTDDDINKVGKLSASVLDRICLVAQKLNKLMDRDLEDAKGNLHADPSGVSISR